jgi:hypothetical protein
MRATVARLVTLALLVAACSPADEPPDSTTTTTSVATTSSSSTSTSTTTSTTVDDRELSPLNGLPVDDPDNLERRVMAVKIDNHPNARPQSGIQEAEAVVEIRVEGSFTRFIALFHTADSEYLGPIRSARPSDATVIFPLSATMVVSGGQPWVRAAISAIGVPFLTETASGMFRISSRRAPHNLYGSTLALRETADSRGFSDERPAQPWLPFGEMHEEAEEATSARITFAQGTTVTWDWDGEAWARTFGSSASSWRDQDGETGQVTADTVVALVGNFYTASPPAGQSGSSVPATDTVGEGRAVVLSAGRVIEGTWSRDSADEPFTLLTADGEPMMVPPGFLWLSIVPNVGSIAWD